jgi:hypothetical protein
MDSWKDCQRKSEECGADAHHGHVAKEPVVVARWVGEIAVVPLKAVT